MRKVNFKGRCEKRVLSKCKSVFKSYDPIQNAYAEVLEANMDIVEIQCNVPLESDCISSSKGARNYYEWHIGCGGP